MTDRIYPTCNCPDCAQTPEVDCEYAVPGLARSLRFCDTHRREPQRYVHEGRVDDFYELLRSDPTIPRTG